MSAYQEPLPDEFLVNLARLLRHRTGMPVEYITVTYKNMDREPVAVSWRSGMYDRPLPGKMEREDPDGLFGEVYRGREREDKERRSKE